MGAAIADRRRLGHTEARIIAGAGGAMLALAVVAVLWPRMLTVPVALLALWMAIALLTRASSLYRARRAVAVPSQRVVPLLSPVPAGTPPGSSAHALAGPPRQPPAG